MQVVLLGIPKHNFYHFCLIFYVYINIHEYLSEVIRIFNQLLFGTKFCSLG